MAQTAKTAADKSADVAKDATDNIAELGKRTVEQGAGVAREAADRAEDTFRRGADVAQRSVDAMGEVQRAVTQRSAQGTAEFGRALIEVMNEQTRHNLETFSALTQAVDWDRVAKAVDWDRVVRIQGEYLRVSLERAAQLTQRYIEVSQAVVASAASVAQRQAKKAA